METSSARPRNNNLLKDIVIPCTQRGDSAISEQQHLSIETFQPQYLSSSSENNCQYAWEYGIWSTSSLSNDETSHDTKKRKHIENTTSNLRNSFPFLNMVVCGPVSRPVKTKIDDISGVAVRQPNTRLKQNWNRYQAGNENFAIDLKEYLRSLRDEISGLKNQFLCLSAAIPAADNVWQTSIGYFRFARHQLPLSTELFRFVSKAMASDVVYNSEYGIEAMVQSWYFMNWFGDVKEELENLSKVSKPRCLRSLEQA